MNPVYPSTKCMCGASDCLACFPRDYELKPVRDAKRIADLESLLGDIYDELEGMEDADCVDGRYVPNFAMSIRQRIDEVLG